MAPMRKKTRPRARRLCRAELGAVGTASATLLQPRGVLTQSRSVRCGRRSIGKPRKVHAAPKAQDPDDSGEVTEHRWHRRRSLLRGAARLSTRAQCTQTEGPRRTSGSFRDLSAYTPGSVPRAVTGHAVATIYLGPSLPTASSNLPAGVRRAALPAARSCSGWGLPSRRGRPRRW